MKKSVYGKFDQKVANKQQLDYISQSIGRDPQQSQQSSQPKNKFTVDEEILEENDESGTMNQIKEISYKDRLATGAFAD